MRLQGMKMENEKKDTFDYFEIVMMVLFGFITILIYGYCWLFLKLSEDWLEFVFAGCLYFFLALIIWLDKSRDEKGGIEFWPTLVFIFLCSVVLWFFYFLLDKNFLFMPHGFFRYGLKFIIVVIMAFGTVIFFQKAIDFIKK